MEYYRYPDFIRSLRELHKKGGKYKRAADQIDALLGRLGRGEDPFLGLTVTHYGESRIRHCLKYDLTGYARLVTVQTDGFCIFVYCGTHDDADEWLETNRGWEPSVDKRTQIVTATFASTGNADAERIGGRPGHSLGPLYARLPEEVFELLVTGIPRRVIRGIEALDTTATQGLLWTAVANIEDSEQRLALHDVLALLVQDKVAQAIERARLFLGDADSLESIAIEQLPELIDSDSIQKIPQTSPNYAEAMRRFAKTASYRDWMLFMHPEQQRLVDEDFAGPAKLVGVSGSGKTCVVVKRAMRLASDYPHERILIVTLNPALAGLISSLVDTCANEDQRLRIDVKHTFQLFKELVLGFEPALTRHYDDVTWKTNEHVDEIWQEFYRCETNNYDARVLQPVHDSLLSRNWDPERYLREEIDWLRSALPPKDRSAYLEMTRTGRTVMLPRSFREAVLEGASGWEEKMSAVGVIDNLGLAQILARYVTRIRPVYRSMLVDEAQDLGNTELQVLKQLVQSAPNDILLCGDAAQAVSTKHQSLKAIDLAIPGARSRRLSLNYRNSRDILAAAYDVLATNVTEEMIDREDFEILHPELSAFSAATPLLLEAGTIEEEIAYALVFIREALAGRPGGKGCLAICGYSQYELARYGADVICLPVLNGSTTLDLGDTFLSDLEQTKGFEFDVVCVVNCREGTFPSANAPDSERFRDLARAYVAMTRAKTDLVVSWSRRRSPFFRTTGDFFLQARWEEYVTLPSDWTASVPQRLEAHRRYGVHQKPWNEMSAEEFLYTGMARGLSVELISRMRELVDGKGLLKARERVRWRTLGSAAADYAREPRAKRLWGPEVGRHFVNLIERLRNNPRRLIG